MSREQLILNLRNYYNKAFPVDLFYDWLSYGDSELFSKREFSFTLDENIYLRYQSFGNAQELKEELRKKNPIKIDIGAVYNIKPKLNKTSGGIQMIPLSKELVFDIDLTDYDDVRQCCKNAEICEKCWTVIKVAVKIINNVLKEDFGFDNVLWVYSGRRGVHCWVSDSIARSLPSSGREAIVSYLTLVKSNKVSLFPDDEWNNKYHPSICSALAIVKSHFTKFALKDQKILDTPSSVEKILAMLPNTLSEFKDHWKEQWFQDDGIDQSEMRWQEMVVSLETENHEKVIDEIMLTCLYPRLDANVSIGVNHLLKSPFCVHPETGRICVPFNAEKIDDFDPFSVPTIQEILNELIEREDIMSTCFGKYLDIFRTFVDNIVLN